MPGFSTHPLFLPLPGPAWAGGCSISRLEAKQTEKLIELMTKVDEMRERTAQTVTSLEDLLGKAVAQQDQMKSIEDQLRQAGQAQGQAVQSPPQAQAAVSALEERMAELGSAMRRQVRLAVLPPLVGSPLVCRSCSAAG